MWEAFAIVEHVCTAIVVFYAGAELYGMAMSWYTNRRTF